MKRILHLLVVMAWATTIAARALPAIDNFPGVVTDPLSGNWTTPIGSFEQGGVGDVRSIAGDGSISIAYWSADAFGDDQRTEVVLTVTGGAVGGPGVRVSSTGGGQGIFCIGYAGGGLYLTEDFAGSDSPIHDFGAAARVDGDTIAVKVVGSTGTCEVNGTPIDAGYSVTISSGGAGGILGYITSAGMSAFVSDNVGGGGGPPPSCRHRLLLGVGC